MREDNGVWAFSCIHAKNGTLYYNTAWIYCPKCRSGHYATRLVIPSTKTVMDWTRDYPAQKVIEIIKAF